MRAQHIAGYPNPPCTVPELVSILWEERNVVLPLKADVLTQDSVVDA